MTVTLYHNPDCGTSRKVLALLQERGITPVIVEYLKTPLDKAQLTVLLRQLKLPMRDLLRSKEKLYAELELNDPEKGEEVLLGALAKHPILMNRPIVTTPLGAKLCRPAEAVLEILPLDGHAGA